MWHLRAEWRRAGGIACQSELTLTQETTQDVCVELTAPSVLKLRVPTLSSPFFSIPHGFLIFLITCSWFR